MNKHHELNKNENLPCLRCKAFEQSVFFNCSANGLFFNAPIHRTMTKNEILFSEHEICKGVFCIREGQIEIRKINKAGTNVKLTVALPGEILGVSSIFNGNSYSTTAIAISDCKVCEISKEEFERLIAANPIVGINTLHKLSSKLNTIKQNQRNGDNFIYAGE